MDMTVYPGSRLARLPPPLRGAMLLLRELRHPMRRPAAFVFNADGLATEHYSPFKDDAEWQEQYDTMMADWWHGAPYDVRWRMWTLTEWAKRVDGLGAFAEFGTYRGGCAYMVLSVTSTSTIHLFDTFDGIPETNLLPVEREDGFAGRLADTSVEHVQSRLASWPDRVAVHPGDVFETLEAVETGPLALVHMDLNAAMPTLRALEYAYPRMIAGGVMVFDDYGQKEYGQQRQLIDEFFATTPDGPIALPTSQAVLVKHPRP